METEDRTTGFKHKLAQFGRSIKKIDVRQTIVDNPFAAIGIAAAAGAILGVARPMPQRSRIGGAIASALGFVAFKLIREAAIVQLGTAAKNFVLDPQAAKSTTKSATTGATGGVRYTPAL